MREISDSAFHLPLSCAFAFKDAHSVHGTVCFLWQSGHESVFVAETDEAFADEKEYVCELIKKIPG